MKKIDENEKIWKKWLGQFFFLTFLSVIMLAKGACRMLFRKRAKSIIPLKNTFGACFFANTHLLRKHKATTIPSRKL